MTSFATPDELESYLGLTSGFDDARAQLMLDIASEDVRNYCNQQLDHVDDDAIDIAGNGLELLPLPELPVLALTALVLDGTTLVEGTDYRMERVGELRRLPARWTGSGRTWWPHRGAVWSIDSKVSVIYTHGLDPIPNDIRGVCLRVAARAYRNPEGATEQAITNYTVVYGRLPGTGAPLTADDEKILDRYRIDV